MSIDKFKSNFKDFVRQVDFEAVIFPPPIMKGVDSRNISLLCFSANTPNKSFNEMKTEYYGIANKKAAKLDYDTISLEFYLDSDLIAYNFIDSWMNKIFDIDKGFLEYFDLYSTTVDLYILNNKKERSFKISLLEAYPTQLGGLPLNWQSVDSLLTLQVNINFKNMKTKKLK